MTKILRRDGVSWETSTPLPNNLPKRGQASFRHQNTFGPGTTAYVFMNPSSPSTSQDAFIERIVQEVIRRLMAMQRQGVDTGFAKAASGSGSNVLKSASVSIADKLITAATLENLPPGTDEVRIGLRAIVTPLARDDARDRSIRLIRTEMPARTN